MGGEMLRTFVGVRLSQPVREELAAIQAALRHARINLRWVKPDSIHLTLLFLGATPAEKVDPLAEALAAAGAQLAPFRIAFRRVGAFPSLSRARVVWVGIDEGREGLAALHAAVREAAARTGCRFDDKPFSPHATLGRLGDKTGHRLALPERLTNAAAGEMTVSRFALIASELAPGGSRYSDLAEIELAAQANP